MWESLAVGHLLEVASYIVLEIEGGSVHEAPAECLLNLTPLSGCLLSLHQMSEPSDRYDLKKQ